MSSDQDSELHLAGCCCFACADAAAGTGDGEWSSGETDPLQPVEQNAGGTSYSLGSVSGDGLQLGDYVLSGLKWDTTQLTFSFPDSINDYEYSRGGAFEAFNAAQKAAALYAFGLIEQYTAVRFTQLTGSREGDADLRLAEESSASTAYAYYPSDSYFGGDAWFNTSSYNNPVLGNYAFTTIVHEIGHAMGLKHGHETDFAGALPYLYDSHEYSVMTYRSYVGSSGASYTDAPDSGPQTYMMADIAALQTMYGANYETLSGNSVYTFDQTTGQMSVDGAAQLDAGGDTIFRTLWDGNGVDTYDLSNFTTDLAIDLRPGEGTDLDVGGLRFRADLGPNTSGTFNNGYARKHLYNALLHEGDTRSLIENANGGSGDDTFIGNGADNRLDGGAGNDSFADSAGSDTYIGGSGTDEVGFAGSFGSYSFNVGASFLEVIGDFVDYVSDTVERLLFSDRSWDYAALVDTLAPSNPDAIGDAFAVQESDAGGLAAIGSVLANDTDEDDLPLTVTAVNGQAAAVGSVIALASGASLRVGADGSVSYGQNGVWAGLDEGETGTDSFTYTISNGNTTDTATVVISIDGVPDPNLAPAAVADGFGGSEGATIGGNVLDNDSDPDGDAISVTGVNGGPMSAILVSGATVAMNADGTFTYWQNGAFDHLEQGDSATDSFSYTIADAHGATSTATVTIAVAGASDPNAAPAAAADAARGAEGGAIGGDVLANDSDPDGDTLQVVGVNGGPLDATLASGATVSMNADGTFSYRQNGAFDHLEFGETATDSFSYTVSDGRGGSATATVTVAIDGVTQDPALSDLLPRPGDLVGTAADDAIRGERGSQAVFGLDGDDVLDAKYGSDILAGGAGSDRLRGDKWNPTIHYFGTEQKNGVVEVDTIDNFRVAMDAINLGGGSVVSVEEGRKQSVLTLAGDGDRIVLRWVPDVDEVSFVETVPNRATDPDNKDLLPGWGDLTGTADGEDLVGTDTGERLFGLGGGDWMYGEDGDDVLVGGWGNDKLYGGAGADTFVFQHEARDGSEHHDAILDFEAGDRIRLIDTSVTSFAVRHNGIVLELAGDGDDIFVKHVFSMDDLSFV